MDLRFWVKYNNVPNLNDEGFKMTQSNAWKGDQVPDFAKKIGAVFIVAGSIEVARIVLTVIASAFSS